MAEWLKAVDCKSPGNSYVGSNPTQSNFKQIVQLYIYNISPDGLEPPPHAYQAHTLPDKLWALWG